jgi:hypothetical protein
MDFIKAAVERFVHIRAGLEKDEALALGAAARRYVASQTELDPIDKYCDLWESCEFATLSVKAKGGKVGRIAEAITSHWNQTSLRAHVRKADVERVLNIKALYDVRGRIVHEAVDAPADLSERTYLLEAVAAELLRFRLGVPFSTEGRAFERLASLTPQVRSPRSST